MGYWSVTQQIGGWFRAGPFALIIQETHAPTITTHKPVIKRDRKAIWAGHAVAERDVAVGEGKQRLGEMARAEVRYRQREADEYDAQSERLAERAAIRALVEPELLPRGFRR